MSELDIFKGNSLISGDLMKELMETNKRLMGSGGGMPRISIRGGRFRLIEGGEQVSVSKSDTLNVMVLEAATISRTFYEGAYDPENPAAPTCWSQDSQTPAADVPEDQRKAARCADCAMNIKGSGQGNSRACRFAQRLAVMLEGDLEKIYQMQLPATSIFGDAKGSDMGLQAYVKFLHSRGAPIQAVMTEMRFDDNSETPKLFFKPSRALTEAEVQVVLEKRKAPEVQEALTLTVSQADNVQKKRDGGVGDDEVDLNDPKGEKRAKPAKAKPAVAEDDEVEEPKKVVTKAKAPAPAADEDGDDALASVLSEWDD
ncbi:MAG TPA: hypothetical protein VIG24_15465 [Acidimicrobiia bacterium]